MSPPTPTVKCGLQGLAAKEGPREELLALRGAARWPAQGPAVSKEGRLEGSRGQWFPVSLPRLSHSWLGSPPTQEKHPR